MDRKGQLKRKLTDLNNQFASWVQEQHKQNVDEVWLDGTKAYQQECQSVLEEYRSIQSSKESTTQNGHVAGPLTQGTTAKPTADPFAFLKPADSSSKPFSFGPSSTSNQPAPFTFGSSHSGLQPGLSSENPFSVGGTPQVTKQNGFASIHPADNDAQEPDEIDDTPPIELDPSADVLFAEPASLFVQTPTADEAWTSRGKGKISLRRPGPDSKSSQCYLVFTTESGRVLVNASLYKGLCPIKRGKGRLLLSLVMEGKQKIVILRLNENKCEDLAEAIGKHTPQ